MRSEHSANKALDDSVVRYSESWMRPSKHAYKYKQPSIWQRLIRWIAGH